MSTSMDDFGPPRPLGLWGRFAEWMGWHKPSAFRRLNLASANANEAYCLRCGQRLLMDSQGNWFAVAIQDALLPPRAMEEGT